MGRLLSKTGRHPATGDIIIVKVAGHFNVCRAEANGDRLVTIEVIAQKSDALILACRHITGSQRVFLQADSSSRDGVEIDCANPYWLP
jgi:hypothetical protein